MKMTGVAISSSVQFMVRTIVTASICAWDSDLRKSFVSFKDPRVWDKEGLSELNKLAWSTFLLKVMGWWAFDVFTLMVAMQNHSHMTSAQTIMRNIGLFTFMIPVGFSNANNFLTGKYIGKNRVDLAKRINGMCKFSAYSWAIGSMAIVFLFED